MRHLGWLVWMGLVGCIAEGDLPETDAGLVIPDVGRPDVPVVSDDAGTDEDFVFGVACDALLQDCAQGKCVPTPSTGGATCLQLGEQRPAGAACDTITQCEKGAHCALLPDESVSICRTLCDRSAPEDTCPEPSACIATLSSGLGLCVAPPTPCDIYVDDCAAGECVVSQNPISGDVGTFCGRAGTRTSGEACGGAAGECEAGNICVLVDGQSTSTCHPICRRPEDGPIRACPGTMVCSGTAASSGVSFCQ